MSIRDTLSNALTEELSELLPGGSGDKWGNQRFTIIFNDLQINSDGAQDSDDGLFDGVAQITGRMRVQVHADDNSPLDLTNALIHLHVAPLQIEPDPTVAPGTFQIYMLFKPTGMNDLIYESLIVPELIVDIEHCYVLRRNEEQHFTVGQDITLDKRYP
jgi:hypothetical protein